MPASVSGDGWSPRATACRAAWDSRRRPGAWLPLERARQRTPLLRHHRGLPSLCLSRFMTYSTFPDVAISLAQRSGEQLPCQPAGEIKSSTSSLGRALVVVPHPPRRHPDSQAGSEGRSGTGWSALVPTRPTA